MKRLMKQLVHTDPAHRNIVLINWILGNKCNYDCPYCPEELNGGSHEWVSVKDVEAVAEKAINHYVSKHNKKLYFCLNGGEVTCCNELYDICGMLDDKGCGIALLSNGSASLDTWEKLIPLIDHVCFSYHPFFSKSQHFIDVVDMVHSKVATHVSIMMHPDRFNQCQEIGTKMLSEFTNISMSFSSIMKQLGVCQNLLSYTREQQEEMDRLESAAQNIKWTRSLETYRGTMTKVYEDGTTEVVSIQQLTSKGESCFKNWLCYAGSEMLSILYDGNIYPAWCFEGEKMEKIGTVYDDNISFPESPLVCPFDNCWDYSDLLITKTVPDQKIIQEGE